MFFLGAWWLPNVDLEPTNIFIEHNIFSCWGRVVWVSRAGSCRPISKVWVWKCSPIILFLVGLLLLPYLPSEILRSHTQGGRSPGNYTREEVRITRNFHKSFYHSYIHENLILWSILSLVQKCYYKKFLWRFTVRSQSYGYSSSHYTSHFQTIELYDECLSATALKNSCHWQNY